MRYKKVGSCPHKVPVAVAFASPIPGYGYLTAAKCKKCNSVRGKAVYWARKERGSSIQWKEFVLKAAYGNKHEAAKDVEPCDRCSQHRGILHLVLLSRPSIDGHEVRASRKLCTTCRSDFDSWWEHEATA